MVKATIYVFLFSLSPIIEKRHLSTSLIVLTKTLPMVNK